MDRLRGWAMVVGMDDANMSLSLVMSVVKALWAIVEACLSLGKGFALVEWHNGVKWSHSVG